MAMIVPDLPEQVEEDIKGLEEATKDQGELPTVNEQVVQELFTEFELQRVSTLRKQWGDDASLDKPPFAALLHDELVTEEKIQQINGHNDMPNDRKFWAYVLEAYDLNILQPNANA